MRSSLVSDKARLMSYRMKLGFYLSAAFIVAFFVSMLLAPYGRAVNLVLVAIFPLLAIVVGRKIFGRKNL